MAETLADLVVKIGADSTALNKELGNLKKTVEEKTKNISEYANKLSTMFAVAGAGLAAIIASTIKAAAEEQKLAKTFENMTHSAREAANIIEYIGKFSMSSAFGSEQIEQAAASLGKFGLNVREVLPLVSDLAAKTGKSIEEVAEIYGRLSIGGQRAGMQLKIALGISADAMKRYGMVFDEQGKLSVETTADIERNVRGLNDLIKNEAEGASKNLADSFSGRMASIKNSVQEIKEDLGTVFLPAVDTAAQEVLKLTKGIKDMSPAQKESIANNASFAVGMTLFGVAISQVITWAVKLNAVWPALSRRGGPIDELGIRLLFAKDAFKQLTVGSMGFMGVMTGIIAVTAGLSLELLKMKNEMENLKWQMQEQDNQNTKTANRIIGIIKAYDLMGESSDKLVAKLKEQGFTAEQVQGAILGLQVMYRKAASGNALEQSTLPFLEKVRDKIKDVAPAFGEKSDGKTASQQIEEQRKKDLQDKIKSIEDDYQQTKQAEDKGYQQEKAMREKILVMLTNAEAQGAQVKDLRQQQEKKYNGVLAKIYKEGIDNLKDSFSAQLTAKEDFIQRMVALGQMDEAEQQRAYKRIGDWVTKFKQEHKAELAKNPDLLKTVTDAEQKITIDGYNARKAENKKYFDELEKSQNLYLTTVKNTNRNNVQAEIDAVNTVIENYRLAMKKKPAIHKEATDKIKELEASLIELTKQRQDQEAAIEEKRLNASKETKSIKIEALARELESGKDTSGEIIQLVQDRMKIEFDLIDQKAKRELDSFGNTQEAEKAIMLETANFKSQIIKQEVDYIKNLIKSGGGDLKDLEYRLKSLFDSYQATIKNGKTPEGAQMQLGMKQINETAAYLKPVQSAADTTATALNSLGYAAQASATAIQQQAGSYGYSPTGGSFKQLSGFGTGTGGAFPSMSAFSNSLNITDKGDKTRNLWKEMSTPDYSLLNPDNMQPNAYYPASDKAKDDDEKAAKKAFAEALRNGTKVDITINGKSAAQASIGGAGQAAVAAAAQTNYNPDQASGLNGMPSVNSMPTVSGFGN